MMHDKQIRPLRLDKSFRILLLLAAGLAGLPAASFAADIVLASTPMLTLSAAQHTVRLDMDAAHGAALRQIVQGQPASLPGDPVRYRFAALVLDDVTLTPGGARGGYFYKVYLSAGGDMQATAPQQVGTLGPFEIAAARQRGVASIRYTLDGVRLDASAPPTSPLVVTFQRADGVDGPLIGIGSVRVALSTEPVD